MVKLQNNSVFQKKKKPQKPNGQMTTFSKSYRRLNKRPTEYQVMSSVSVFNLTDYLITVNK